jgi:dienelactone hydrolase
LIAYHRPKNAAVEEHALMLERWVRTLLAAGVPASRITIVGFSRGSGITAYASARLRDVEINTALMGACANGDVKSPEPLVLGICSISTRPRTVFCRATCWRNAAS